MHVEDNSLRACVDVSWKFVVIRIFLQEPWPFLDVSPIDIQLLTLPSDLPHNWLMYGDGV